MRKQRFGEMPQLLAVLLCIGLLAGVCAGCTTPEPEDSSTASADAALPRELTVAEKEAIQAYLNEEENNGFLSHLSFYSRPEDVSLFEVFYSCAPIVEGEEREACLQAGIGIQYAPLFKVTPALAETTVQEKLGISLADVVNGMKGFSYLESTDAYYIYHTDTNYCAVTVTGGAVTLEGLYAVHYYLTSNRSETATVTLRKTETGYQFVSNLPDAGSITTTTATFPTTTTTTPKKELTAAQREEIEAYLNRMENNGFISPLYATPQEISLRAVFYDGAGIGIEGLSTWSEEEKQAVLAEAGWDAFHGGVRKLPVAKIAAVVEEKLGIPLSAVSKGLDYVYVEAYDAYYTMHSDSGFQKVTVTGGWVDGDIYAVYYTTDDDTAFTVVLRRTDTGYRFVANMQGKKP